MQADLEEAARRIEEARRTQAEVLDLGDLALSELPVSLGDLPHLKDLYLGKRGLNDVGKLQWYKYRRPPEFKSLAPLAGLSKLQNLDLSNTLVTDLAPLVGLQELRRLTLSGTAVMVLRPLARLQGLQSLYLGDTKVTDLSPLAGLQGLRSLDLSNTTVTNLASLAGLQGLQSLYLANMAVTDLDLAPLAGLKGLQNLSLHGFLGALALAPLAGLQGLRSLDLMATGVRDLAPLAGCRGLQSLYLRSSIEVTDLVPLAGLQELEKLFLGTTGVTDLAPLAGCQRLRSLDLAATWVTDLAPLAELQELQSLNLADCRELKVLAPLARVQGLQSLHLSRTGVTDLAPLAGLQRLQSLYLAWTHVMDLTPLAGLQELQNLYLTGTRITDLAPLAGLRQLQSLHLGRAMVTDLAPLAGLQGLQELDVYECRPAIPDRLLQVLSDHLRLTKLVADEAIGVPREVLSRNPTDDCLPRVRSYVSELNLGIETENEVKVILLGNSCVGKTQLCRRLRGQPFDESVPSTHGVQIWREEMRIQTGGEEQIFQINWWDFGGQDIYHGTHALFLCSRAVFLILWTPELENREESGENGIPLRNQPLAYWLDYVRSLAGEGSPVIVGQSKCDRFADQRPSPARPDGLGFYQSCSYSAKTDLGRDALEAHLRDAIRSLLERNGALAIGCGRAELRLRLYEWRSEDQKCEPEERRHRTLTLDEFRGLCDEVGGIVSWEHALDYLHDTGVVFYEPHLFSNRIILDQTWALDAIYTVFQRGRAAPWLRDSGRFTREDLALMVWQEHSIEEQRLFLGLMESCGVCFPCGQTARGEPRYVAPDLLPGFETVSSRLHAWKEVAGAPTLRLEYRFLHPAVIRGLMSEIGSEAGDIAEYWKYGLWFKDGKRDSQLLVQAVDTSRDETPGAGALEMKAQGGDALGLLREIRRSMAQRIGEEPEEILTLDSTTVARSALAHVVEDLVRDLQGRPVSAAPFTDFFTDRDHDRGEALVSLEAPEIDIIPRRLTMAEKPREIFISYAWGDDSPEGKIRTEAVEGLCSALEMDGFLPVRDRDRIHPGDLISAFINRLTHADLMVAVISDKYLRSPYCMYEIYRLWQRVQAAPSDLAQCVVPIVLPSVSLKTFRERLVYMAHWAQEAESLEALIRNPKLRPGRQSWEEVRLVREFAHHVDDILAFFNDVLMERRLEVHLDNGFEAVREALRRRMGHG